MATIFGSQFVATDGSTPVNVGFSIGGGLSGPVSGDFNLAVSRADGSAPSLAAVQGEGYQGLAVLSPSGLELDLIGGAFAVTDNGTGLDTLSAYGSNETISGGNSPVTLNVFGGDNVANAGPGNADIEIYGGANTVNAGSGNDLINGFNNFDAINLGSGADTLNVYGANDTINGGSGPDTITVFGGGDTINGGSGANSIGISSGSDTVNAGSGPDTISAQGSNTLVNAGSGDDTIGFSGLNDTVTTGTDPGSNQNQIAFNGANMLLVDGPNVYADTVVGFSQSAGDRIHLTGSGNTVSGAVASQTQINGGQDTLITLTDSSTILLKGIAHIDSSFFS